EKGEPQGGGDGKAEGPEDVRVDPERPLLPSPVVRVEGRDPRRVPAVRHEEGRGGRADPAHEKVDPGGDRPPSRDRSAEARLEVLVEQGTHPEPDDPGEEVREEAHAEPGPRAAPRDDPRGRGAGRVVRRRTP